ncbi:hypothetical protein ACFSJY_08165 [Thalassotalea euphylliae]|uniref:hypothetical protein n=1 Tax=Thalassotalea euphylliae TaxID=1655234 RepID=UPI00363F1830
MIRATLIFASGLIVGGVGVFTWLKSDYAPVDSLVVIKPIELAPNASVADDSNGGTATIIVESNDKEKIAQLEEEVFQLKMEVVKAKQHANDAIAEMRTAQNNRLKQTVKAKVAVNYDDLLGTISEPFATKVYELNGGMAETFMDYYEQEQNSDWAYDLEYKIKDAITMHEQGINVRLESVICKTSICEVRGFQTDVSVWMKIGRDIMSESWWPFVNSNSTNHSDPEYGDYFYVLLSTE